MKSSVAFKKIVLGKVIHGQAKADGAFNLKLET